MKLEEIKKLLTEAVGADQATKVTESLEKFQTTVTEEAQAGVKNLVAEGVKAERIKLEADYLGKLEAAKEAGDKTIREEVTKYEKQLAERVKHLLIQAIDSHGDRLARIAEQTEAKRGTALLEEVEKIITKGKAELAETTKADPKALEAVKGEVKDLKEALAAAKKEVLEHKARANVAEQSSKELQESLEASINVVVEETEVTKTKPAGEEHQDSKNQDEVITEGEGDDAKPKFTPEMQRLRKLAGIKAPAAK